MNPKISCLLVMMALSVAGCNSSKTEDKSQDSVQAASPKPTSSKSETPKPSAMNVKPVSSMYGYYVGNFVAEKMDDKKSPMYSNKINISIDSIKNGQISGHSIVAGNNRPFIGTISETGPEAFTVQAKEPGNDKYDGEFKFSIIGYQLTGTWKANDKNLAVTSRSYELNKTIFKYNPHQEFGTDSYRIYNSYNPNMDTSEYITSDSTKFNASTTLLTTKDVENMYKRDLEVIRNTIYARHGYSFQNREMRYFFDNLTWYIPVSIDVTKELTDIETKNIKLLKRYEKHAASYYDNFGR